MNKKSWPIASDTSCYLKWSWSTIYLNRGTTASCHRTVHNHFTAENFDEFHNLPKKLDDRRRMLAGGWPEESETTKWGINGCTYCKHIEDLGGVSDRQVQLRNLSSVFQNHTNVLPPELLEDPNAVSVTPTIVEVYFNNVCNMACLYCGPHFSTMWEEENRRFNAQEDGILANPMWQRDRERYDAMRDKLFAWLRKHGHKIWNFGMLGGEPFFQKEFDMVLDHWDDYPNPDLTLTIVTNLKVEHDRFVRYIDRLKHMVDSGKIKSLNISASLDCWGPQAEYLRWGLNLDEWSKNFAYMVPQEWITLNVNITITPLSIKTLPDFLEKINAWDQDRLINIVAKNLKLPYEKLSQHRDRILQMIDQNKIPQADIDKHICISFMHVLEPTQMNPLWFGQGVFTQDMQRVVDLMPVLTEYQRNYKTYMQGIANSIEKTPRDPKKILMLETYMNEMDRRRGTHWPDLFPLLVDQFNQARNEIEDQQAQ
jgi:organic radical activating enzyme